ncbi:hypothetical protein [Bacillus sp. NPDC094077]
MSSDESQDPFYQNYQLGVLDNNIYLIFSTKVSIPEKITFQICL